MMLTVLLATIVVASVLACCSAMNGGLRDISSQNAEKSSPHIVHRVNTKKSNEAKTSATAPASKSAPASSSAPSTKPDDSVTIGGTNVDWNYLDSKRGQK